MNYEPIDENLDQPATKRDLVGLATKDDLKTLATKEELKSLRKDLVDGLASKIDMQSLKETLPTKAYFDTWKNEISEGNDKVAKDYETFNQEKTAWQGNWQRITEWANKVGQKVGIPWS